MNSAMSGSTIANLVLRPHLPLQEVERRDDSLERQRQPEHEQQEQQSGAGDPEQADREAGHRRDGQGHRHDGQDDERAGPSNTPCSRP